MLNGEPIGNAQSYVALGSGDGWWEEETDPSTRNRPVTAANASQLGKGETKLVRLWLSCCSMIPRSPDQTDPSPSNSERSSTAGLRGRYRNHPRWSSRVHGSNARHSSEHAVLLTFFHRGDVKGWRLGPSCQTLNIMRKR